MEKIPTCHRASYDSIIADDDYKSALENADMSQRIVYEEQAREIDRIQKDILTLAQKEEKYDVFICYKETDADGKRTQDSVIANDIYYQLTNEGFKVFYAAITLEGKLGSAYEPIIFAALNSAKVMLAIGTKPEYFNAVWVKNEWSRFLNIIKKDRSKLLIPCYRDMDAYELPEEFAHLQAQDMAKIGFINDVVRGITKVVKKDEPKATTIVKETVVSAGSTNTAPLLERAFMFLEDGDWNSANEYCEKVLDIDPKNAQAYLGKLMAECRVRKQEKLKDCAEPFDNRNNYQKAIRFGNDSLKSELASYIEHIKTRNENARLEGIYTQATNAMNSAKTESEYKESANIFKSIFNYKDSASLKDKCIEKAEIAKKDTILYFAKTLMKDNTVSSYRKAISEFASIPGWKDSKEQINICESKIEELKVKAELEENQRKDEILNRAKNMMATQTVASYEDAIKLLQSIKGWRDVEELLLTCAKKLEELKAIAKHQEELARIEKEKRAKHNKKIAIITIPSVCAIFAFIVVFITVIVPNIRYNNAIALMNAGNLEEAYQSFASLGDHKDSMKMAETIKSNGKAQALSLLDEGKYNEAADLAKNLDFKDTAKYVAVANGKYSLLGTYFQLTNITLPADMTNIDTSAFKDCRSLKSITLPPNVKKIDENAFEGCSSLTSITIPSSVKLIKGRAFAGCTSLKSITFEGSVAEWEAIAKGGNWKYQVPATVVICSDGVAELS